jgi:hypothetical protein
MTVTQDFALRAPDGTIMPFPAAGELTMQIDVLPCRDDASSDAGVDPPDAAPWVDAGAGCEFSAPSAVCGRDAFGMRGRCTNTSATPWPDDLFVTPLPPVVLDVPTRAALVSPPERGACFDRRTFDMFLSLPFTIGAATYVQSWTFMTPDGGTSDAWPVFTSTVSMLADCDLRDAGTDARPPPRPDAAIDAMRADVVVGTDTVTDEAPHRVSGCACRARTERAKSLGAAWFALACALGAAATTRRRRRRNHGGST